MFRKRNRKMQCGFCTLLSSLLRSFMCIGSRRGSTESYYRELGDQDTLKVENRSSSCSDVSEIVTIQPVALCPRKEYHEELANMALKGVVTGRFLTLHRRRRRRQVTRTLVGDMALLDDLLLGQCILNNSVVWRFNAFTLENVSGAGRCLPVLCVHLFHMYGLIKHFKLDAERVWKLFSIIEEGYHSTNPYHNSVHAADVTQAMHCFLQQERIREHMQPMEVLGSLLAAIAHDLDHPGVNQPFLIATSNHLAALYNNTSVLENHHWRSAVSCILESRVLAHVLVDSTRKQLVEQISSLILATDITRQQEYLSRFKGHIDNDTLDMTLKEHRHLVLQIALKCADISNPCRPWEISRKWSLKVCEEFFRQGDYERKLKLPVTALCDRHTTSIPKIQTGFFKFVVTPLIQEWHRFLQNDLSKQMMRNLLYNQNKWETLMAEELAEETKTEVSEADIIEDDDDDEEDEAGSMSDSAERLLPLRRRSLTTKKRSGMKRQIRRFSVPLNVFQDSCLKNRETSRAPSKIDEPSCSKTLQSPMGSEHSLHSQLSISGHCEPGQSTDDDKALCPEKLLPDSSIASITTPAQASRLQALKLVRQQTFPPLESTSRGPPLTRSLFTSNEDAMFRPENKNLTQMVMEANAIEEKINNLLKNTKTKKTDKGNASGESSVEKDVTKLTWGTSSRTGRRESAPIGSQLRDNMTSVQLSGIASDPLLQRRKSMPTDVVQSSMDYKLREISSALPELLRRTLSGKDSWSRRRGSAPAPVMASDLAPGLRRGGNSGRRKQTPLVWLSKASCSVPETFPSLHRRSSLPVEAYRLTEGKEQKAREPADEPETSA
ncbi:uncharacterized protein [Epargyreus clarus]|uniref:uncharacterized protein isoform X2 n=1 Tax=Epargyreus clarus TaxID=520877 RepID=UPI003C2C8D6E